VPDVARTFAVLDAPSNLGLRPPQPGTVPGVAGMAAALRRRGLVSRLGARNAGRVDAPPYSPEPDLRTGFRNGTSIGSYSERLALRIRELVARGEFPVVLGGDCSILLGVALGLKSFGRYGLAFVDGHDDFAPVRRPEEHRGTLAAAGRDLGLVTGHGPEPLTNLQGAAPYVAEADVVVFGSYRDPADEAEFATEAIDATRIHQLPIERVRALGCRPAAQEARSHLESPPLQGFWIHVDVDVLDRTVLPAVDSPNPNGLQAAELVEALRTLLVSPRATGIEFTIYDPDLDPTGTYGDRLAGIVVDALSPT